MSGRLIIPLLCVLIASSVLAQEPARQITSGEKHDCDPAVSPDGKHLAFSSNRTGNYDIYLLTFGESGFVQMTQSEKDDGDPSWSPNNKKIVFASRRTGKGDLYEMAIDGSSGYLQLTDRPDLEMSPSYTKSGDGLLFVTAPKKRIQLNVNTSIVLAADKGAANNARVLSEGEQPRFSPDGKKVVFVSERTKNKDIWIMDGDGGSPTQLTTSGKDDKDPCFSPSGKQIVFASKRTGNYDIWVMNADGGDERQLTGGPADETQPCWSSGGYIYYTLELSQTNSNIYRIQAP